MMKQSFFFYDLETSGVNPAGSRIMQFAGQRTDLNLQPIGEPVNTLVKLSDDILPEPYAVMVHGVTPQKANEEGISEPELCELLQTEVFTFGTIAVGFNNLRFDDEFIRYTLYRNLYEPYEREWSEERSRWDVLDLFRMARALRPDGIKWPIVDGKPTNRLEELAKANKISHENAHDALSDVMATIELTRLLKELNPKLFDWYLELRKKQKVAELVNLNQPQALVYSSGRYSSDFEKTTIVWPVAPDPVNDNAVIVYDLRVDPSEFVDLSVDELAKRRYVKKDDDTQRLPVKTLAINKSPAIAPITVLDKAAKIRLKLDMDIIKKHIGVLAENPHFGQAVGTAFEKTKPTYIHQDVEFQLYDSFIDDKDKKLLSKVRQMTPDELSRAEPLFVDERYSELLFRYRARNYPESLSSQEMIKWEQYKQARLAGKVDKVIGVDDYVKQLEATADKADTYLIEELKLYLQSIVP